MVSTIQQLAEVKKAVGEPFYLRLGEELLTVHISEACVMLAVRTVRIKEYSIGYKVVAQGTRLITWELQPYGTWTRSQMTTWDSDFKPYEVGTLGGKSIPEWRERREWEDDCYRPGNGTRLGQRDSTDRAFQGYDYTQPQFYSTTTPEG